MTDPAAETSPLVREARPSDAGQIAAIGRRSFTWAFGPLFREDVLACYLWETYSLGKITESLTKPANHYLVVEVDAVVQGFLKLKANCPRPGQAPTEGEGGAPWQTQKLYVDPDVIQRGLGRRLMQTGEDRMVSQGAGSTWLIVYKGNERTLRFYSALGFETAGTEWHDFEDTRIEFRLMVKRYSPGPEVGSRRDQA